MTSHPYGVSKLTAAHSTELLSEARRRQLASTAPRKPRSALRRPGRLMHASVSRILALAGSLLGSAVRGRRGSTATTLTTSFATPKSAVTREM